MEQRVPTAQGLVLPILLHLQQLLFLLVPRRPRLQEGRLIPRPMEEAQRQRPRRIHCPTTTTLITTQMELVAPAFRP